MGNLFFSDRSPGVKLSNGGSVTYIALLAAATGRLARTLDEIALAVRLGGINEFQVGSGAEPLGFVDLPWTREGFPAQVEFFRRAIQSAVTGEGWWPSWYQQFPRVAPAEDNHPASKNRREWMRWRLGLTMLLLDHFSMYKDHPLEGQYEAQPSDFPPPAQCLRHRAFLAWDGCIACHADHNGPISRPEWP